MLRVVHISDLHLERGFAEVPWRQFFHKRALGYMNLALRRRKHFEASWRTMAAVRHLLDDESIDLLVCTGDFTALGTEAELRLARATIDEIRGGRPLLTVPGNHDVYMPDTAHLFGEFFSDELRSDAAGEATYPWLRKFGDTVFVGVNSARPNPQVRLSSGRIDDAELRRLEALVGDASIRERRLFVLTHYAPLDDSGKPDKAHHGLENGDELLDILRQHPRAVLLHGHIHRPYHLPKQVHGIDIFCAASTTQAGRNGLWCFDIHLDGVEARQGIWRGGKFELSEPTLLGD